MTAKEFWKSKFYESPQEDSEKLAIVMMTEYASRQSQGFLRWVVNNLGTTISFDDTSNIPELYARFTQHQSENQN